MKLRKKLIEVALPLEAINKAARDEKAVPRPGHPQTLHYWWARRPLAAARAVIFSQMVDDPSEYVETLKSDPKLLRRAESELKKRHRVWEAATTELARAEAAGVSAPPPGPEPTLDEIIAEQERDRLFKIIEDLVLWENTTNEAVLEKARAEIWQSWRRTCADNADHPRAKELFDREKLPGFHDPFAGGGALPLEAQRLGLEVYASDLNPVAVLINKAMIEIPPRFVGMPPVNPEWQLKPEAEKAMKVWRGAEGLAEDVRYYGKWIRDEAEKRIGHLYPKVEVTEEIAKDRPELKKYVGKKLTIIASIWARTVKSPNPAFRNVDVPLASTFMLSAKAGKETFVKPEFENGNYRFTVKVANPPEGARVGTKLGNSGFKCLLSDAPIPFDYLRSEAKAGRMGSRLMALVAEGDRERIYLEPNEAVQAIAMSSSAAEPPQLELPAKALGFRIQEYGMLSWADLFHPRQLAAMTTFSDLVREATESIISDASTGKFPTDARHLFEGGSGITAYAEAITVYLAFALSRLASYNNTICHWNIRGGSVAQIFTRHAIPMSWDFIEVSPLQKMSGNWSGGIDWVSDVFENLETSFGPGEAKQANATNQSLSRNRVVSTDPPYYDNIGYADLSDFFYVWLRRSLRSIYPDLLNTLTTPKADELLATPYRHKDKRAAESFFLEGMVEAMQCLVRETHPDFPITIYYAFKQSETQADKGTTSTGWETFLGAVIRAGLAVSGTWPVRTEKQGRSISIGTNALASSIVLVCRKRAQNLSTATRRDFVNALKAELPEALRHLQHGNIAPVDLAQAAIGPGMAVFTRYEKVLDAEGMPLTVRDALALINQTLDEVLAEQEGDFDADTRWALTWFEENGFDTGEYGRAEQLSKAKNTSISEMADPRTSPILEAKAGKVRLFRPEELQDDWAPESDGRLTVWDMVHQLIRVLEKDGELAAAQLAAKLGAKAETTRELCYRLYTMCERKKRNSEALSYNGLVQSWPEIMRLAREVAGSSTQTELFE